MTVTLELPGLAGTNPLGFLAALGVLWLPDRQGEQSAKLAWTDQVVPHAVVSGFSSIDDLVEQAMAERERRRGNAALLFTVDGEGIKDVKFSESQLRRYLLACLDAGDGGRSVALASALVTEGSYDNSDQAKPTDLHFVAGQQKLVQMARELLDGLDADDLCEALKGPWGYGSKLPSFMWDVTDDRLYVLSAFNPSSEKKQTEPGAEFLALLGLTSLPVFAGPGRTRTTGCGGSWKAGEFRWPIWGRPCDLHGARSLIAHATLGNEQWLPAWGIRRLLRSAIRRSEQGGYGTFSPPIEVWRAPY